MMEGVKDIIIDDGSSQGKSSWFDGGICLSLTPSRVVQGKKLGKEIGSRHDACYKIDGSFYTVDPEMDGAIRTDLLDYQFSDHNAALVHEILRQNGFGGQDVRITTTLPIDDFFTDDDTNPINKDLIKKKKNNYRKEAINLANHPLANIVEINIFPEAIPAWYDYLFDDNGNVQMSDIDGKIMIVDLGGTTTDITTIDQHGTPDRYTSVRGGVFAVGDHLQKALETRFNLDGMEKHHVEYALKNREFAGDDIKKEVRQACKPVEQQILLEMRKIRQESKTLEAIIYVGGGAALMGESLAKQYGGESIFGDEFSIVRGILKMKLHQEKQKEIASEDG